MALVASLLGGGCERSERASAKPPEAPRVQEFQGHGIVKSLRVPEGRVVIAHEEIRGYMPAMTMEFQAASAADLESLEPGDVLGFRLVVTDRSSAIDHLKKNGHAAVPVDEGSGQPAAGASLPDGAFTDEQGRAVHLSDFRGRVVALTFIFTRCPLPDYCPRLSRQFADAARALGADQDAAWQFISVTMDPANDTPTVLAEYAKAFGPAEAAGHWSFLTGAPEQIGKLGQFCGLATRGQGSALEHNLRTVVFDREGKVARVFAGNEWRVEELVDAMRKAAK